MTTTTTRRERTRPPFRWYLLRRWVYGLALAVGLALVYYRLLEPQALAVLLPIVLALFNTNPAPTPDEAVRNDHGPLTRD
jgi:hypothetical protein